MEQNNTDWHKLTIEETAAKLETNLTQGLTEEVAVQRNIRYGSNSIVMKKGRSPLFIFLVQFKSILVILLILASLVALILNEIAESVAVLSVIFINAIIGFITEFRAEKAVDALKKQAAVKANVIRDGVEQEIDSENLTVGDIVLLYAGSRVPADGRLTEAANLQVDETSLTGESMPITKIDSTLDSENVVQAERKNMCYMGTIITAGRGEMLVTAIGKETEVGKIGEMIDTAEYSDTPLQIQINQLGKSLIGFVGFVCIIVVLIGYLRGEDLVYMLKVGISLAIATIPGGLPAVATITLALGVQRMAKLNALIRNMHAVETLGATTVICTDKTGTLTKNELTVRNIVLSNSNISIDGSGYNVKGELKSDSQQSTSLENPEVNMILRISALCNDAGLKPISDTREYETFGDPTEIALLVMCEKAGMNYNKVKNDFPRVDEISFDSDRKYMATVNKDNEANFMSIKGAAYTIISNSTKIYSNGIIKEFTKEEKFNFQKQNDEMGGRSMRVLAFGFKNINSIEDSSNIEDMVFVGLVAMTDPLRNETKSAIELCKKAGIRVIMITGDQLSTAQAISNELGLNVSPDGKEMLPIHANDLIDISDRKLKSIVANAGAFARVSPALKLQIVKALKASGEVVAMTGDGINDAPALKSADIGVAMGLKGTQVAKEASHMIIADDNFSTITKAIEEGRTIYSNIRKFIIYLFSCNLSEIVAVFFAIVIGLPVLLNPLQILWLNIVTDVFPALSLALEPKDPEAMSKKPRDPKESLVNRPIIKSIVWQGLMLGVITLVVSAISLIKEGEGFSPAKITTMSFMVLALSQTFHVFNAKSQTMSFRKTIFSNKWTWVAVIICILLQILTVTFEPLMSLLKTESLDIDDVFIVVVFSLSPILISEIVKFIKNRRASSPFSTKELHMFT